MANAGFLKGGEINAVQGYEIILLAFGFNEWHTFGFNASPTTAQRGISSIFLPVVADAAILLTGAKPLDKLNAPVNEIIDSIRNRNACIQNNHRSVPS